MDKEEVMNEIKDIMCEEMELLEGDEFKGELNFEDYGIDSLKRIDILDQVSKIFDIEMKEDEFSGKTVDDLASDILNKMS